MPARKALIATAVGRPRKTRTPMIRREKWSTRFTGSGVRTSADDPCSSSRIIQEATVASVTKHRSAVWAADQPRAARSSRIARRSTAG
jgi:hypothetical protein